MAKFPPALEQAFQDDLIDLKRRSTREGSLLGITLFSLFAVLDYWAIPGAFLQVLVIRFGVVVPILIGMAWWSGRASFARQYPWLMGLMFLAMGLSIEAMIWLAQPGEFAYTAYYAGLILVVVALYAWTYLDAVTTSAIGFGLVAIYLLIVLVGPRSVAAHDLVMVASNLFFFVSSNIIGLYGLSVRDKMLRDNFLLRQSLQEASVQSQRLAQAKGEFLANMSHEIRTPMNAVLGLAHLLGRQNLPEEAHKLARQIHQSGQSLLGIINDILDVSKIESGKIELEQIPFQLSRVLDNLATLMAGTAQHKAIELVIIPPFCSDWPLRGDPLRLGQVLINLTNNAIKFTDSGLVEVRIELLDSHQGQLRLRFAVHDTGIGIDAGTQTRLFQPFAQADASTRRRFGGSGLGLVIARRLVELMGGRLQLDSVPGQGSTFRFELPFPILEGDPLPQREALPMQVLVVAEHPDLRAGLLETVTALRWSVQLAQTPAAAVNRVIAESALQGPDTVVLLGLAQADGLATAQAIRAAVPEAQRPLIFTLSTHLAEPSLGAGLVDDVLTKPLTPSPLYDAVVLARHRRLGTPMPVTQTATQFQRLAGLHLLVVDDNEINREVAQGILTDEGADISLACDGQEALNWLIARADSVDLVLMDIQMPVMDGMEATRAIRQHPGIANLPVIALTAGAMPEQQAAARQAGVDGFLSKPFDVDEAVALIGALTGRVEMPRAPATMRIHEPSPAATLPGLDLNRALSLWKDTERYRTSLRKFADEQRNLGERIAGGEPDQVRRLAHAIKGAAGNLGLTPLADSAAALEHLCITPATPRQITAAIAALRGALTTALDSIARYAGSDVGPDVGPNAEFEPSASATTPPNSIDPALLATLIQAAHAAFADFEPDQAEAPVCKLTGILSAEQLAPLQRAIENLDASGGAAAAGALAKQLGLTLETAE